MAQKMISRLRLRHAFKNHTPSIDECLTLYDKATSYIADDKATHISHFAQPTGEHDDCLKVLNLTHREIALLSIDNKLMSGPQGGVADCAVFDDRCFWLTEFKTDAQGNSTKAIQDTYNKAIKQLANTIDIFSKRTAKIGVDFVQASDLHCDIVTAQSFPSMKAMEANLSLQFAIDTGGIPLQFERTISF